MQQQAVLAFLKVTDLYKGPKHLASFSWQEVEGSALSLPIFYFFMHYKIELYNSTNQYSCHK